MNRIIILAFDYPPNNGGIARLCGEISKGLESNNIDYHVVTNVNGKTENEEHVTRIIARRVCLELKMIFWLRHNTDKSDIIICDTWHPAGTIAMLARRRFVILAHGAEFLPGISFFRTRIWPRFRQFVLKKSVAIVANSHYTANLVDSLTPGLNVVAIPLAIDAELFHPTIQKNTDDDILRVCSISRLEKFKGHDFVIKTIAKLKGEYRRRIKLEIGGKGPYKKQLEKLVKELGLWQTVSFIGFLPEGIMNDFYSRNDLFILCTREEKDNCNVEGFGLVFVEAQACGTACIGTNIGGIPDAIHNGRGGWLITPDSEQELTQLLCHLIDNKNVVQQQGVIARQRVIDECNQQLYINSLIKVLNVN